jgi:L-malate glycosyltransferase
VQILFYNHTGKVSGAERVLLMILAGLDRGRFNSVALCPTDGPLAEMIDAAGVRRLGIKPLQARFTLRPDRLIKYVASFLSLLWAARAAVITEAPDLVHANSIRAGLLMSAATVGLRIPIVWHVHDLLPRHPFSSAVRFYACASRRTRVIAVSRAVADRFQGKLRRWFRDRIRVIHNAVDTDRFFPDAARRRHFRAQLHADSVRLIGIIGQLTPRKGQLEVIQVFNELAGEFSDIQLLIIGEALFDHDRAYADLMTDQARRGGCADRIRFLGPREDVPDIVRGLDVLVVNSQAEPFGLTVIEGMAAGTAVLATPVDGIKEIIRDNQSGRLLRSLDLSTLRDSLRELLSDAALRQRLGQQGRQDAMRRFASDRFLKEIQTAYDLAIPRDGKVEKYQTNLTPKLSAD